MLSYEQIQLKFLQICLLPPVLRRRHSREHHISPQRGQQGKLEPMVPQDAQAVRTRNFDASSRASRIGRSTLLGISGDVDVECTGVAGPADDGAVERFSDSE